MQAGETIPAIALYDTEKQKVWLNEPRNKNLLLLFFPLAFTSVCTAELCNVRDNISIYNNAQAQVYGISVDSLYTLKKFREEQHLNFPLLSDFNKAASIALDVLYETFSYDMQGVSKRAAFVADKNGMVRYAEVCASPADMPDFTKINQALAQLNH